MSGYFSSRTAERLDVMEQWDVDSVVDALRITTEELLSVPEFKHRAERWIEENT